VYYALLFAFSAWSCLVLWWADAAGLFKFLGNMAGVVLAVAGVQVFRVNRRFLPRTLRPPLWREVLLIGCSAFYGFFAVMWLWGEVSRSR
jgi:hypothetical protein